MPGDADDPMTAEFGTVAGIGQLLESGQLSCRVMVLHGN
jgi:hypothetical protein